MKKLLSILLMGIVIFLLQGHTAAPPALSLPIEHKNTAGQAWLTYYWYADSDFATYTGYTSAIDTEVSRLRVLYPSYNFSSTPAIGMDEFEYGMHPFYVTAVIYSNM